MKIGGKIATKNSAAKLSQMKRTPLF